MIQLLPLNLAAPRRWRNGGGETRELLAWPAPQHWSVRVSVADIDADGPFSAFPGVQRWFAVVEGEGVVLRFADRREVLTIDSPPLAFDGALAPGCDLQGGATRDLNLMVQSDAGNGAMRRVAGGEAWSSRAGWRAVFCRDAARLQIDDADAARLPPMTLAWSDHGAGQRWRIPDDGTPLRAWWLEFQEGAR